MVEVKESIQDKFTRVKNRIDVADKIIKEQSEDWDCAVDVYEGKILEPKKSDFSEFITGVNLWYVDVRSTTPKLYTKNPYIYIDPETPESDLRAEIMEKVVNAKLKTWKLKERVRQLVQGTKLKGRAYLKTSYKFDEDSIGREFIENEPNDEITINYIDRSKLLIDPDALSFESRRWAAHKIHMPIEKIRRKYKLKEDDKPAIVQPKNLPDEMSSDEKEDFQYGSIYEIENVEERKLSVIVDGVDRFVVKPYDHLYKFSLYDSLEWNDIPERLDTKNDLHFWKKLLLELAETKTQQVNHRRKLNSKYKWHGTGPDGKQEEQLTTYRDASFVVLGANQDFEPVQHATLGQEVYQGEQSTRQDITIVSAMNEMRQGLPQTQKTAREAMAIYQEGQDVMSDRAGRVDDVVASVINKCIQLIQDNYDTTRVMAITAMEETEFLGFKDKFKQGKLGMEMMGSSKKPFISFVGARDLAGKMSVRVQPGSSRPVDESQRKEEIMTLLSTLKGYQQLAAVIDNKELMKEIGKLWHLDNKKILIDPKNPNQENILLKRNIPVMPSLNEPHDEHIVTHEMENNNTPAFIAHLMVHKLMKEFLGQSGPMAAGPVPEMGGNLPGGLNKENISGVPMGSSVPPEALPQQPQGGSPAAQPMPSNMSGMQ